MEETGNRPSAPGILARAAAFAADPIGWRRQLCLDLRDATGSVVALCAEVAHQWDPASAEVRLFVDTGWPDPAQERSFIRYQTEGANAADPFRAALCEARGDITVGAISRMVGDAYFESGVYHDYIAPAGIGDMLTSATRVGPDDLWNIVTCMRMREHGSFADEDIALIEEMAGALRLRIGFDLADASDPVGSLTHRRRAALEALLNGLSERDASEALGVTVHTFHSHVRDIFAHFGVRTRAELQALFYGRGRLHPEALHGFDARHNRIRRRGAPMARPWSDQPNGRRRTDPDEPQDR